MVLREPRFERQHVGRLRAVEPPFAEQALGTLRRAGVGQRQKPQMLQRLAFGEALDAVGSKVERLQEVALFVGAPHHSDALGQVFAHAGAPDAPRFLSR